MKHISFVNQNKPKSYFEVVRVEELLNRKLDHDIFKNHIVNFFVIFFIVDGEGYHTIDFTDYKCQKGTVLLIRKDQIHRFFKSPNIKGYLLIFTEEFLLSHLNELESSRSLNLFNELLNFPKIELKINEREFYDFGSFVTHLESECKLEDEYSRSITRSILHAIITKLFRFQSKSGRSFDDRKYLSEFLFFQELVEKECFQSKKVIDYALKMSLSTKTLNNIVQTIVNKSAKTFINEVAILQIKRLLISTNKSIKEIAYTSGFDDPSNFFKYFKKHVGSSPEVFRKAYK